jgi:hypothetical protein
MKKILFLFFLVLALKGYSQFGKPIEKVINCGITAADSFFTWIPFKFEGYNIIQVDFSDFSATDSCLIDFFYLFEDKTTGKYVPTRIEQTNENGEFPKKLKKATFENILNGPASILVNDSTSSIAVKIEGWNADGLGFEVTKYSATVQDTIKIRPRR